MSLFVKAIITDPDKARERNDVMVFNRLQAVLDKHVKDLILAADGADAVDSRLVIGACHNIIGSVAGVRNELQARERAGYLPAVRSYRVFEDRPLP